MDNIVMVGTKPFKTYNFIIKSKLESNNEVVVKTRGKNIGSAVNIVTFLESKNCLVIKSVKLSSSIFTSEDKREHFVPEIEIIVTKFNGGDKNSK